MRVDVISALRRWASVAVALAGWGLVASASIGADEFDGAYPSNGYNAPILSADGLTAIMNGTSGGIIYWGTAPANLADIFEVSAFSANGRYTGIYRINGNLTYAIWDGTTAYPLEKIQGYTPYVRAISADGRIAVGSSTPNNVARALYWDWGAAGAVTELAHYPGTTNVWSRATGVSDDGAYIVGYASDLNNVYHVVRWTRSTNSIVVTGTGQESYMSTDGRVIVGQVGNWRWVDDAGGGTLTQNVNFLPGAINPYVRGLSDDGSVVIGTGTLNSRSVAFRWDTGVGTTLADLSSDSTPLALTGDGRIIVGLSYDGANRQQAVRWSESGRIRTIADILTAGGVDVSGWRLLEATAISDDGHTIVGNGRNAQNVPTYWFTRCVDACSAPDPVLAVATPEGTAQSFAAIGTVGATTSLYLGSELNAAGDMAAAAAASANPVSGFAYGAYDSDPTTSASAGLTWAIGDDIVVGGALGVAGIVTEMPNGGRATFSGPSLTGFVASRPETGLNWTVGGSVTGLGGTINRGYLNGNTPVTSTGNTTGSGFALSGELGFTFNDLVADVLVTPFVNITVSSASYSGYSETGGPFPANFSAFSTSSALFKAGVEGRYVFSKDAYLTGGLAYGHNAASGGSIAGSIPSVIAMSVGGATLPADFVEASIGVDLPIHDGIRFSGRLALTTPFSGIVSVQARAGVTMAF